MSRKLGQAFGLAVLLAVFGSQSCATAAVHDLAAEFSTTSNPNGVWTYGYMTAQQFTYTNDGFLTTGVSGGFVPYDMVGNSGGAGAPGWTTSFGFPFAGVWSRPETAASVAPYPSLTDFPSAEGDNPNYPNGVVGGHGPNCNFCSGWYAVKYTAPTNEVIDFESKSWQTAIYPNVPPNPLYGGATRSQQILIQKQVGTTYSDLYRSPMVSRHGIINRDGTPEHTAADAPEPGKAESYATQADEINASIANSERPNISRLTNISLSAGQSIIISFAPYNGENHVGFLGFDAKVTSGADRVATTRWDLATDFSVTGASATGVGPDAAWSYGMLRGGNFSAYNTIMNGVIAEDTGTATRENHGWGTQQLGWFAPEALNVAEGPVTPGIIKDSDGFNALTGGVDAGGFTLPPDGDWTGGKVMLHTPSADIDAAQTSVVRWTAPRSMTVNASGGLWRGTLPDDTDRTHQYKLLKNGTMIASGTIDELSFDCGAGGTNSACAESFTANNIAVVAGDRLDLQILPASGGGNPLGDFNNDGQVDARDYTVWRDHLGSTTPLPNDNGLGGPISQSHYTLWKTNYGSTGGGGGAAASPSFVGVDFTVEVANLAAGAVPEPSAAVLALLSAVLASLFGRRSQQR
ncbi:MAG: hypothetical protein AB7G28_10515 [Pirellulales bacterium]